MINWKLRLQNKTTLWSIIALAVSLVYTILDAVGVIPAFSKDYVLKIAAAVLDLLVLLGIVVDPTTAGVGDSQRALGYDRPWKDGDKQEYVPPDLEGNG